MTEPGFQPFSCRFREAIFAKKISISLSGRLRRRLSKIITNYDSSISIRRNPNDNWFDNSTILWEIKNDLFEYYGEKELKAYNDSNERVVVETIPEFLIGCYPAQVFDVIEILHGYLDKEQQNIFQTSINTTLRDEKSPWLLCDGTIFHIDSQFLEEFVLSKTYNLLKAKNFQGALDEFAEARKDMESSDYKDVVLNSCKAFESVLKVITKKPNLECGDLIGELQKAGFYKGLPDKIPSELWKKILQPLCLIRNKVSAHGQGEEIITVPETLARFSLNLSGSAIVFLVEHYLEITPNNEELVQKSEITNDDLPF